jgi:hypothetical protein
MKIRLPSASAKDQVSISSTFYDWLFCTKVFLCRFSLVTFGFIIFWQKNISKKAARNMLMKLDTQVSISLTFTTCFFVRKCFCAAFMCLQFVFAIFLGKNIVKKATCNTLMKLGTGVTISLTFYKLLFCKKVFAYSLCS